MKSVLREGQERIRNEDEFKRNEYKRELFQRLEILNFSKNLKKYEKEKNLNCSSSLKNKKLGREHEQDNL